MERYDREVKKMKKLTEKEKLAYAEKVKEAAEIADMSNLDMITRRQLIPTILSLIASPIYYARQEATEEGVAENTAEGQQTAEVKKEQTRLPAEGTVKTREELLSAGWKVSKNPDVLYLIDTAGEVTRFIRVSDQREWSTPWKKEDQK